LCEGFDACGWDLGKKFLFVGAKLIGELGCVCLPRADFLPLELALQLFLGTGVALVLFLYPGFSYLVAL